MNYGKYGRELLLELHGTPNDSLPAYNASHVQSALMDLQLHVQALEDQVKAATVGQKKPSFAVRPSLMLQEAAIQRNKRCLLTYHRVRMQRLEQIILKNNFFDNNNNNKLSPAEQDYAQDFIALQQKYVENCGLTTLLNNGSLQSHGQPPVATSDRVTVRVEKIPQEEGPQVVLDSGCSISWVIGSTHSLLWTDAQEWIQMGVLRVVQQEEEHD